MKQMRKISQHSGVRYTCVCCGEKSKNGGRILQSIGAPKTELSIRLVVAEVNDPFEGPRKEKLANWEDIGVTHAVAAEVAAYDDYRRTREVRIGYEGVISLQ